MKYEELSEEQRFALAEASRLVRVTAGEFARLAHKLKLMQMGVGYQYVNGVIAGLDGSELIPNSTGLAGTSSLPAAHWQVLDNLASAVSALATDEVIAACVEAAGPTNCIG